jgi:transposase InsO family protein
VLRRCESSARYRRESCSSRGSSKNYQQNERHSQPTVQKACSRTATVQLRSLPEKIRVDNRTEFTSKALDHWAYRNHVELDFSGPGRPADNAFIEAFNVTLRRECLFTALV